MLLEPIVYWSDRSRDELTDEEFMEYAEEQGKVFSLQGFKAAFNTDEVGRGHIRIMWVETNHSGYGVEVSSHGGCKEIDRLPIIFDNEFEVGKRYKSSVNPIQGLSYEILSKNSHTCTVRLWEHGMRTETIYQDVQYTDLKLD